MNKKWSWLGNLKTGQHLADLLALLGVLFYSFQSYHYAIRLVSMLDEGAYLYKGWLFVSGIFHPFQEFGPWTNKPPLAFLIPGWFQQWFEMGLRTGRFLSIFLGVLTLLGLWWVTRRLAGNWAGASVILLVVLNPALIKAYSLAVSQVLVAFLLVWMLVLTLGGNRKPWQILIGVALAVIMSFTRQNMVIVLPILFLYIFWQHGKKMGWWSITLGIGLFLLGHLIWWPGMLQIWLPWMPAKLTPFLDFLRLSDPGTPALIKSITTTQRLQSVLQGLRMNFLSLAGMLMIIILWPLGKAGKTLRDHSNYRSAVFLLILQVILVLAHAWASLFKDYCTFCFNIYLDFFAIILPLLLAISFPFLEKKPGWLRGLLIFFTVPALFTGIGLGNYEKYGYQLRESFLDFLHTKLPRVKNFFTTWKFQPGTTTVQAIFENKFGIKFDPFTGIETYRQMLPALAGLFVGLLFIFLIYILYKIQKKEFNISMNYPAFLIIAFVLLGSLFSPLPVLGGGNFVYDCDQDSLSAYERTGKQLNELIPPGSQVYWDVSSSSTSLLLYLPDIRVYPQQINWVFSYQLGGNTQEILSRGQWNDLAAAQWLAEADFIIIEEPTAYRDWNKIITESYEKINILNPVESCTGDLPIVIYRKVP